MSGSSETYSQRGTPPTVREEHQIPPQFSGLQRPKSREQPLSSRNLGCGALLWVSWMLIGAAFIVFSEEISKELGCPGLFAGLSFLIGLVILFFWIKNVAKWRRLRSSGRQTQAFIFDRWEGEDAEGDPTYFVAYAFGISSPGQAPVVITRAERNEQAYERCRVGDFVPVRYLPDDPNFCCLEFGSNN